MHTQLTGKFFVFNITIYNSAINYFLHSLNLLQEKKILPGSLFSPRFKKSFSDRSKIDIQYL